MFSIGLFIGRCLAAARRFSFIHKKADSE